MKIILTTTLPGLDAEVDPRFGRGTYLLLTDTDTLEWQAFLNPGADAPGGAGVKTVQFVTSHKAEAVLSGDFGPNAFDALKAAGVKMLFYGDCRTARDAVERFKNGQLQEAGQPASGVGRAGHRQEL
jgi:predicted Fe-Mo cluster-binding NifX family protein